MKVAGVHINKKQDFKLIETDTLCFLTQIVLNKPMFSTVLRQRMHVIIVKYFLRSVGRHLVMASTGRNM
jgi:hypothetical protein